MYINHENVGQIYSYKIDQFVSKALCCAAYLHR